MQFESNLVTMYEGTVIIDRVFLEDDNLDQMPLRKLRKLAIIMHIPGRLRNIKSVNLLKWIKGRRDVMDRVVQTIYSSLPNVHQHKIVFYQDCQIYPLLPHYNQQWHMPPHFPKQCLMQQQYPQQWPMQTQYQHRWNMQPQYEHLWYMQPQHPQNILHQHDQQQQQCDQHGSSNNQDNINQKENTRRSFQLVICPDFDCNYKIPLLYLSNHIYVKHSTKVVYFYDWETEFTLNDLQIYTKILQIQSISNRIFLTVVDFHKEFLRVVLQHLPDGCTNTSTAIVNLYRQKDVVCTWERKVATAEDSTLNEPKSYFMINTKQFLKSEKLRIRSVIFVFN